MSLITCASGKSLWRGIDYFESKKVVCCDRVSDDEYKGTVQGGNGELYTTLINLTHPRKSKCNCSFADGRRVVCKHMIALYFTVFPHEVEEVYRAAEVADAEVVQYEQELAERVYDCVMKMNKAELQTTVLQLLDSSPEWIYERFVWEHDLE